MWRYTVAVLAASAMLLCGPALARAADEQPAPPEAIPTRYKLVVEQYSADELVGSSEFTVSDTPGSYGVQL